MSTCALKIGVPWQPSVQAVQPLTVVFPLLYLRIRRTGKPTKGGDASHIRRWDPPQWAVFPRERGKGGRSGGRESTGVEGRVVGIRRSPAEAESQNRIGVGAPGERAAEDVAKASEVQLTLGTFDFSNASNVTFEKYAREWLDTHGRTLKLGTAEKYAEVLRVHWFPSIGSVKVASVTRAQVKAVVSEKARTYARETVSYMTDVLRSCLHSAVEDGILPSNPAARLGALATKGRKATPVEAFAPSALAFILSEANQLDPPLYPIVLLLARTGMRIGEALAL